MGVSGASAGRRSLLGDLGTSLLAQVLVVAGNLATLKCAAWTMSVLDVSEFVLVRRVVVFLAPLLLLGLGVGLPRSLGRRLSASTAEAPAETHGLQMAGWLVGSCVALVAVAVLLAFPAAAAQLLFGDAALHGLVTPLAFMLLGHQLFMLVYAMRRGRLEIQRANLLQSVQIAVWPLIAVLWRGKDGVEAVLHTIGVGALVISGVASVVLLARVDWVAGLRRMRATLRELLSYGVPRVPGDLAGAGLYALGPILVAHHVDMQAAGLLAVGMSLLTVLSAAFAPIGLVLLPRMSQRLADGQDDDIRRRLPLLIAITLGIAVSIAVVGSLMGNVWLRWIVSDAFVFEPTPLTLLMVAAGANVVFVILRSVIDAAEFRPLNAVHTIVSLAVLLAVWSVRSILVPAAAFESICMAIASGFGVLGSLTVWRVTRRFQINPLQIVSALPALVLSRRRGAAQSTQQVGNQGSTRTRQESQTLPRHERCTESVGESGSSSKERDVERAY